MHMGGCVRHWRSHLGRRNGSDRSDGGRRLKFPLQLDPLGPELLPLLVNLVFVPMLERLQLASMMLFNGAADVADHGLVVFHKHEFGPVGTKHKQTRCQR